MTECAGRTATRITAKRASPKMLRALRAQPEEGQRRLFKRVAVAA